VLVSKSNPYANSTSYNDAYHIRDGRILMYLRSDVASPVWQCRLNVRGIRGYIRKSTGATSRGDAEAFATDLFDDLNYRIKHHMALESPCFSDFVRDEWLPYAEKTLSVHRFRLHQGTCDRYLVPYFANEALDQIRQKTVDGYWDWRRDYWVSGDGAGNQKANVAERPSRKTLQIERSILSQIFKYAKRQEYILAMPLLEVTLNKGDPASKVRPFFTPEEYVALQAYMEDWVREGGRHRLHKYQRQMLRLLVLFLFNTGMRPNEAFQIRWRMVHDPRQLETDRRHLWIHVPPTTKTKERETVPLEGTDLLLDDVKAISQHTEPDDLVWADWNGNSMNNTYKTFETVLKDSGLLRDWKGQKRTFYSCRHSHITYQLLLKIAPSDMTDNLGTSEAQISKHYNHIAARMKESLLATGKDDPTDGITEENLAAKVGNMIKIERSDPALDKIVFKVDTGTLP